MSTKVKDFDIYESNEEFEFFDLSRVNSHKLRKNECSLNLRSNSNVLTMNQDVTKKIYRAMYKYIRLGRTKNNDIIIQLHKDGSIPSINITFKCSKRSNTTNACINSKDLCEKLKALLDIDDDYSILNMECLSADYYKATYKLSKK